LPIPDDSFYKTLCCKGFWAVPPKILHNFILVKKEYSCALFFQELIKTFANCGFQQKKCKKIIVKNFVAMKNLIYLSQLKNQINYYEQS